MALVESFRGEILTWVRLDEAGRIARCHPRDPSWFQWPLLEAAIEGNIVADFPFCNKSFNCSYSGAGSVAHVEPDRPHAAAPAGDRWPARQAHLAADAWT